MQRAERVSCTPFDSAAQVLTFWTVFTLVTQNMIYWHEPEYGGAPTCPCLSQEVVEAAAIEFGYCTQCHG